MKSTKILPRLKFSSINSITLDLEVIEKATKIPNFFTILVECSFSKISFRIFEDTKYAKGNSRRNQLQNNESMGN
jgi:hypothetical protein